MRMNNLDVPWHSELFFPGSWPCHWETSGQTGSGCIEKYQDVLDEAIRVTWTSWGQARENADLLWVLFHRFHVRHRQPDTQNGVLYWFGTKTPANYFLNRKNIDVYKTSRSHQHGTNHHCILTWKQYLADISRQHGNTTVTVRWESQILTGINSWDINL